MNLKSNVTYKKSVVPVTCGSKKGTAFFVSKNKLITAAHVVSDSETSIGFISYNGALFKFKAEQIPDFDISILTLTDQLSDSIEELKLLAAPESFEDETLVVGYPKELGNNKEMFSIKAKVIESVPLANGYNCIMERTEPIAFKSYKGFSGSPVFNAYGSVIGVVTFQLTKDFAFISVNAFKDHLKNWSLNYDSNWEFEDKSMFGGGRCREIRLNVLGSIKGKLNEYHIPNRLIQSKCEAFCDSNTIEEQKSIENEMKQFDLETGISKILNYTSNSDEKNPVASLFNIANENIRSIKEIDEKAAHRIRYYNKRLKQLIQDNEFASAKFLLLYGQAGTGKTHTICQLAEKIEVKCNVYLMLGTQFNGVNDIETEFRRLLGFGVDDITKLDERMQSLKRDAIFIIDALNEGAGEFYWKIHIGRLVSVIEKTKRVKLLVTVRHPYEVVIKDTNVAEWKELEIEGFENINAAREIMFKTNGVSLEYSKLFEQELQNPLFMNIFCEAYPVLKYAHNKETIHESLYRLYVLKKNRTIAQLCDEDPEKNITWSFLWKLANFSVYYNNCQDIPRQRARHYADQVCRRPLWSNNLLKASLDESLLLDTISGEESNVMFQYENLGDVLKAMVFHNSKMSDEKCINYLVEYQKQLTRKKVALSKFYNFVGALVGLWKRNLRIIDLPEFQENGCLHPSIVEAKRYRDGQFYQELRDRDVIKEDGIVLNLDVWISGVTDYQLDFFEQQHELLLGLSFYDLNKKWVYVVNDYFDKKSNSFGRWQTGIHDVEENKSFGITLCWMMASSHPEARALLIRNLWSRMMQDDTLVLYLIEKFGYCKDPYVLGGLMISVYGFVLRSENTTIIGEIADLIYHLLYSNDTLVPEDLIVRQYSLQILERADKLGVNKRWSELVSKCSLRFKSMSPFENIVSSEDVNDCCFYGDNWGSRQIALSMSKDGDFCRYVIGTNNNIESNDFYQRKGSNNFEPVNLHLIRRMVAYHIKEVLYWDDSIANLEQHFDSDDRFNNRRERIGKKFQWVALHNIAGRMCDHCSMMTEKYHSAPYFEEDMELINYPWNTRWFSYFDPTLPESIDTLFVDIKRFVDFDNYVGHNLSIAPSNMWLNDQTQTPRESVGIKSTKGEEWIFLKSFIEESAVVGDKKRRILSYTNSILISRNDEKQFKEWIETNCVYGRWIPESSENTGFKWNEYPLTSTYTLSEDYRIGDYDERIPFNFKKTSVCMLQENSLGLDENINYLSYVYAPCIDMMNVLNLYTAERGVIKSKSTDEIVAVNYEPYKKSCQGLLIKRSTLNEYLEKTEQVLFFGISGEKHLQQNVTCGKTEMKFFSGFGQYSVNGNAYQEINPIESEEDFCKKRKNNKETEQSI